MPKVTTTPNMDYYVRLNKDSPPILGPVSFIVANTCARRVSADPALGMLAEVYTYVGERKGDPVMDTKLEIISIYRNGVIRLGGKVANLVSDKGMPPEL